MNIRVRALDFFYEDDGATIKEVSARFEMNGNEGEYFNGAVKISKAEYENAQSFVDLATIVKERLKEQIASI